MCILSFSIGKGSGYKTSELSDLVEGSSLIIGGKEIEVSLFNMCMAMYICFNETWK